MRSKEGERKSHCLSDETIIELYWARDERAICETDTKYRSYLWEIVRNILYDPLDCEECLNDTYLEIWNAIPPTRPRVFKAFLTIIMRRVAINRYHKNRKKSAIPSEMTVSLSEMEEMLQDREALEDPVDAARLGRVISNFVRTLTKRQRYIFIERYYEAQPIDLIARELKLSRSMVNKELAAIRADLKEVLRKEGYLL